MKKIIYPKKNYSGKNQHKKINDILFITGGDPAGIGPEIIRKSLLYLGEYNTYRFKILYFFNASKKEKELLYSELSSWNIYKVQEVGEIFTFSYIADPKKHILYLYEIGTYQGHKPSEESGYLSYLALKKASEWIKRYSTLGLVTAPLSKEWVAKKIKNFRGHTQFLSQFFSKKVFMIMYSKDFSILPLTEHIPISRVSMELKKILQNKDTLTLLKELHKKKIFTKKWAFCGLNPHAGDNGTIGKEEIYYIIPFIEEARKKKIPLEGPLPADSLFTLEKLENYSLILTCYHDQGLIPFKSLIGREGINVTFGLPFLRTSPDHGTAFDIANKNLADPVSMIKSIEFHYKEGWK